MDREIKELDHEDLANVIKDLHRKLRLASKKLGNPDLAWKEHCADLSQLEEYSAAMKLLATQHWKRLSDQDPQTSRIHWTVDAINEYFHGGGIQKARHYEKCLTQVERILPREKVEVLDVGSCYNPLSEFDELDVLAVDLCPASDSVYSCDFLNVPVADRRDTAAAEVSGRQVTKLYGGSFNCVVFCLLLEYLPSAKQRWDCCVKARDLLKPEGLLVVVTPDSKHANANAAVMKSWRQALTRINLRRVKYQKLRHLHCMAFRKLPEDSRFFRKDAAVEMDGPLPSMMYIPQDLQDIPDLQTGPTTPAVKFTTEEIAEGFWNLPDFVDL